MIGKLGLKPIVSKKIKLTMGTELTSILKPPQMEKRQEIKETPMSESAGRPSEAQDLIDRIYAAEVFAYRAKSEYANVPLSLLKEIIPKLRDLSRLASHADPAAANVPEGYSIGETSSYRVHDDAYYARTSPAGPDALAEEIERAMAEGRNYLLTVSEPEKVAQIVARLRSRPAQDRDAERYRWLRSVGAYLGPDPWNLFRPRSTYPLDTDDWNAAIDAAMSQQEKRK